MKNSEVANKQRRLGEYFDQRQLDGAILTLRANFAWVTGGGDNHIANNTPVGVASILVTSESIVCLANSIEAPRMRLEALASRGIDVVTFPWWDSAAAARTVAEILDGRRIAVDSEGFGLGLPLLPSDFNELRWSLTSEEIDRYREGAARASLAMERACRQIQPGDSEYDAAGMLDHYVHNAGLNPVVTLIASDERISRFRHPIPTGKSIEKYVMLVTCAEFHGLISCLTRFVHFGPLHDDIRRKQQAICDIDATVNLATRPGRMFGQVFTDLQNAYAAAGFADQWQFHHQGGSTGYAGREALATPGSTVAVRDNQAFAWNPSITGVKSEDTVLCTPEGIEVLTAASDDWPKRTGRAPGGELSRADILVQ